MSKHRPWMAAPTHTSERPVRGKEKIRFCGISGGESGIRTHGTVSRTPVFKTGAFSRSAISPLDAAQIQITHFYPGNSPGFLDVRLTLLGQGVDFVPYFEARRNLQRKCAGQCLPKKTIGRRDLGMSAKLGNP